MIRHAALLATTVFGLTAPGLVHAGTPYDALIAQHAAANGVPVELVHRVIIRESRYNPRAVSKGNYGMMQIRLQTARGLGYTGTAQGLLDANTNLTYAVKYLAGAYRVAGGNHSRAVALYASGYYYAAKRRGLVPSNPAGITTASFPGGFNAAPTLQPAVMRGSPMSVMSESGAPRQALSYVSAPDHARHARRAKQPAAHWAAKDQSRPANVTSGSWNPFAASTPPQQPRRSGRSGRQG